MSRMSGQIVSACASILVAAMGCGIASPAGSTGVAGQGGSTGGGSAGRGGSAGGGGASGTAGMAGATGDAGTASVGGGSGTTGAAGAVGSGGAGGVAGGGGAAGYGGTTGAAGTAGRGGAAGAVGGGGAAGAAGGGGATGSGGTTGAGGTAGRGGAGGAVGSGGAAGGAGTAGTAGAAGQGWVGRTPSPLPTAWPPPRAYMGFVFDEARKRALLFGGQTSATALLNDVWEWDGTVWVNRTPAVLPSSWPSARYGHSMYFDSVSGHAIVFGGIDYVVGYRQDVWEWDGTAGTWNSRVSGPPGPASRAFHCMAYDSTRNVGVLFGGWDGASPDYFQDLWEWSQASGTWTNKTPSSIPTSWPEGRTLAGLFQSPGGASVTLFGGAGISSSRRLADLWEWNGASWASKTPASLPASWPPARSGSGLTGEGGTGRLFLFGGSTAASVVTADTWQYAESTGSWSGGNTGSAPAARSLHGLTWDTARGVGVLFGGMGATTTTVYQDLWEWTP